jgi:LAO/AO transport system kinase
MSKEISINELFNGIISQDRVILAKAITLIESSKPEHQLLAEQLIEKCIPFAGNSVRIGITGVPGVGKSTFIESMGLHIIAQQKKVAVLAIDPSSQLNKGSILGDKTRMNELAANKNAFIRPSPSQGTLGGVAKSTHESIILFEAAGFDVIIIETVGVGQSETQVKQLVDCFLLLLLSGAGDELQGIKRGIMEMADILLVNKADGENVSAAKIAKSQLTQAIHFFPPTESGWIPKVELCSALEKNNIEKTWELILSFVNHQKTKGFFLENRNSQKLFWLRQIIEDKLTADFYHHPSIQSNMLDFQKKITSNVLTPHQAANKLFNLYKK